MPPVAGGFAPRLQLPSVVGGSAPRPSNASSHRRFLATRLHEEEFTARYCRPAKFFFYHGFADLLRHIRCPNLVIHTPLSLVV